MTDEDTNRTADAIIAAIYAGKRAHDADPS